MNKKNLTLLHDNNIKKQRLFTGKTTRIKRKNRIRNLETLTPSEFIIFILFIHTWLIEFFFLYKEKKTCSWILDSFPSILHFSLRVLIMFSFLLPKTQTNISFYSFWFYTHSLFWTRFFRLLQNFNLVQDLCLYGSQYFISRSK